MLINATFMQEAARIVTRTPRPHVTPAEMRCLLRRRTELHDRDLANVEADLYPRELLFDIPVRRYLRSLPRLMRDTPSVVRRMRRQDYQDIPPVDKDRYPAYYRRNFHWQTDGYFSDHSAEMYELGVELLFRGTADVMRRQIIPPITRFVREVGGAKHVRLLDVACGTGRTLH
ncbi:MAG: SAM-dependent methyltransferase, partial [Deltaproteobacteria bacterium]|nr:SAM-dependent methyltransferase [Deltaproteobacteria bacterium]